MTLFHYHLLGLAITSASMLGFGLFLLFKNPSRNLNRSMTLYCFSVAWWSGWECAALQMPTRELAFLLMRIEYMGVAFIPTLLCTTVSYLLNQSPQTRRRLLLPLYIMSVLTLIPATFFPTRQFLWVSSGPVFYLPVWGQAGPYYWIFMVFFFSGIALAHFLMIPRWFKTSGADRTRLTLFILGSVLAYVGGCPEFGLKYGFRLGWLNPFGLFAFPIYIGILTYAVVQHQFFGIHIVIRKSLVYSLSVTLLTAGYFGLVYGIEQLSRETLGYHSIWLSLGAFALMALLFQPLKIGIQRLVDWLIFRAPQEEIAKRMERLEEEARQTEKLRAVSTLAAGMAHEIKNPLTAIHTFAEFVPEKHADPEFAQKLHEVLTMETKRIQRIVQEVLDFAKPKPPRAQPLDLKMLLESTLNLLSGELLRKKIHCQIDCQHNDAQIKADPDQLRQVLINLIQNAADAMPNGGKLSIATQTINSHLELTISDTGHGIPAKLLPRIFDPFVTTKTDGNGLGLAMVHSIIRAHGGTIHADSEPSRGTTFTVSLPL